MGEKIFYKYGINLYDCSRTPKKSIRRKLIGRFFYYLTVSINSKFNFCYDIVYYDCNNVAVSIGYLKIFFGV